MRKFINKTYLIFAGLLISCSWVIASLIFIITDIIKWEFDKFNIISFGLSFIFLLIMIIIVMVYATKIDKKLKH